MTKTELKTLAISTAGALALSATCIGAAIAPARAEAAMTSATWQQTVGARISSANDIAAQGVRPGSVVQPVLALRFDAAGRFADAALRRSSGNAAVDAEALAVARTTRYPALPAAYRGAAQTVEVRLTVGDAADVARQPAAGRAALLARADGFQVAGR